MSVEVEQDEHDLELIPEARAHEGATAAAAPPDWWRAAWNTIEHKMDSQAGQLAERMSRMFAVSSERFRHLETALTKQPEKMQSAMAWMRRSTWREKENAENMKGIEERLQRLELNERDSGKVEAKEKVETNANDNSQWRPKHIILGGWPPMTTKAQIEKEARDWLRRQNGEMKARCLQPYAPKKFGEICKIKVQEGYVTKIGWDIARSIERQLDSTRPTSSDVERSPEEGKRRRVTAENMEKAEKVLGESFDFERDGMIYKGAAEVIKHEPGTERWVKNKGFQMAGQEWESLVQKIKQA